MSTLDGVGTMLSKEAFFIGITGSIGSGKSTVTRYLKEIGYPVIDADIIAREVVEPGNAAYNQIVLHFGKKYLLDNGTIDRKKLGAYVFQHESERMVLNHIVHPEVRKMIKDRFIDLSKNNPLVFADVPLLIEAGMLEMYQQIWLVYADRETCLNRILVRDQITVQLAKAKLDAQMSIEDKKAYANVILYNNQTLEYLYEQVDVAIRSLKITR